MVDIRIAPTGDGHVVEVDGHNIAHLVTGLTAQWENGRWELYLTLSVGQQALAFGASRVELDRTAEAALIAMGWEPPG